MDHPSPCWAEQLQQKLSRIETEYQLCLACHNDDPTALEVRDRLDADAEPIDGARIYLAQSLGAVLEALCCLPEFSNMNGVGLSPLRDLAVSLVSLNDGNRSQLLETRKVQHRAINFGERERQAGVVAMVSLFEATGMNNAKAREAVAAVFGGAGLKGRKKGRQANPISPKTIYDWQVSIQGEDQDGPRRQLLAKYRELFFGDPDRRPTEHEAMMLAMEMAQSDMFKSKI